MFKEYTKYDGTGLAELIKKEEVSPAEIIEAAINEIEKTNPKINAVVFKMYEDAKKIITNQKSDGPLAGVPFLIKDLGLDIKGFPTSNSSRLTKNYIAKIDSEIIRRYRRAGLITLGKTNTPEFGVMGVTEPVLWGACRNPWDTNLTPGGSSGGSASAVAARMVPIASADDGGGSIRIPASACGLFGFKPSRGLQPLGPSKNESWMGLVSGHVVTRSVRDSALVLDCTKGITLGAPYGPTKLMPQFLESLGQSVKGKKIAFSKKSLFGEKTEPEVLKALDETLIVCEKLGMEVIEALPNFNKDELVFSYYTIVAACVAGEISRIEQSMNINANLKNVEHATWFLKIAGQKLQASHLEQAIYKARQTTILWEEFLTHYDFFCNPTMAYTPSPIGLMEMSNIEKLFTHLAQFLPQSIIVGILKKIGARGFEKTPNTSLFNMSGHPAMSVPTYWSNSPNNKIIPIGVQFVGRMGDDQSLFSLAKALEDHFNWSEKAPLV